MNLERYNAAIVVLAVLGLGGWDWLKSPDPDIARGNSSYQSGDFNSALAAYDQSESRHGVSAEIRFDVGTSLYKLAVSESSPEKKTQLLEKSESAFREAAVSTSPTLRSSAYHNLGNTMFMRERWPEAIDAYRKALLTNQNNDNARYNLELALRKLEREEQPSSGQGADQNQPQRPGQKGQEPRQGGGGQGQDDSAQPGQGPQSQTPGGGQDEPQNQAQPGQGQKGQPEQQPRPGAGQGQPQDQPQSPQNQPGQSGSSPGGSPQDAPTQPDESGVEADAPPTKSDRDRKLDALETRSRDLRRRSLQRGGFDVGSRRNRIEKDW